MRDHGPFGIVRTVGLFSAMLLASMVHAQQPGSVDMTFNPQDPGFCQNDGPDGTLRTMILQPDGKILVGGVFSRIYGGTPNDDYLQRSAVARFMTNGSLDTTFHAQPSGSNIHVECLARQTNGRILVGGTFTEWIAGTGARLVRLMADGSLDTTFHTGSGFDGGVFRMAIRPNGKIVVAGGFTQCNGTLCGHVAQLNDDGSLDTTFVTNTGSGTNTGLSALALQNDGKVLIGGQFTTFNGTIRTNIARLNADGTLDTGWDPSGVGCNGPVNGIVITGGGGAVVMGSFTQAMGATANRLCRLNSNGTLDTFFDAGTGPYGSCYSLALGPLGSVYIGGNLYMYNGVQRSGIARVLTTGALDTQFDPGAGTDEVLGLVIQADGKPVIAGLFNSVDGHPRSNMARLLTSGAIDDTFMHHEGITCPGSVNDIVRRTDGRSVVAGGFLGYNEELVQSIMRIYPDGELDATFDVGTGPTGTVNALALQADGKVVAGGWFTAFNDETYPGVVRLMDDGSVDPGFDIGTGFQGIVYDVQVQPDGKIVCAGALNTFNGAPCKNVIRLLATGALDTTFDPGAGPDQYVKVIHLQPDGGILIGGVFAQVDGLSRNHIARLNADGSLDTTFDPGTGCEGMSSNDVEAIVQRPDGRILIGGRFEIYNGVSRSGVAGLLSDGSLDDSFDPGTGTSEVFALGLESSGRLIIGGGFSQYDGQDRDEVVRVLESGELDPDYATGQSEFYVRCMEVLPNDDVLMGGNFFVLQGVGRSELARLKGGFSTGVATPTPVHEGELAIISDESASGRYTVRMPRGLKGPFTFAVVDMAGRTVLMKADVVPERSAWEFTMPHVAPGIYSLTATGQGTSLHGRFFSSVR